MPPCQTGLLDASSIHPTSVVLTFASKGVVDTELQRTITAICIRSWRRLEAWWQAYWQGRRYPLVWRWWRRMTAAAGHAGGRLAMAARVGAQKDAVLMGRRIPSLTAALRADFRGCFWGNRHRGSCCDEYVCCGLARGTTRDNPRSARPQTPGCRCSFQNILAVGEMHSPVPDQ